MAEVRKKRGALFSAMDGWFLSLRLKPLVVGIGPVFVGTALAQYAEPHSPFKWLLNLAIVFCVILIQTATHFFNDALDFLKGADSPQRQGPRRAVQKGLIPPSQLIRAGYVCLFLAGLIGLYLVQLGGWPVFLTGIISLFLAYFYTGGPWPLAYTGLADFFVLLSFGFLPVYLVFYLNTGYFDVGAGVAGLQCGLLALSLLVVNNLRDEEADSLVGKKTLVVRWGQHFGLWEGRVAIGLPYLMGLWWLFSEPRPAGFGPFLLLPLSLYICRFLSQALSVSAIFGRLFSLVCLHYMAFVLLLSLAFWLCSISQ